MPNQALFPFYDAAFDARQIEMVRGMAESLGRTVCIARALLQHGRTLDLAGLDRGVGLLCAKALDLPLEAGRQFRPHLEALLNEADRLTAALRAQTVV